MCEIGQQKSIKSTEYFICKLCKHDLFPFHNLANEEFLLELGMVTKFNLIAEYLKKIFLKPENEAESGFEIAICSMLINSMWRSILPTA